MKKIDIKPDFVKNEEEILKFWKENNTFEKLKEKNRKTGKYFTLLDGPITANYNMGLHHAFARTFKDATIKYKALRGYDQHYQNGFDAHGLPVEVGVEKELGINSKKEIQEYGIDKFVNACIERVDKYSKLITDSSIRLGQWMNWDDSYYTNADTNITSIWHFLKECDKQGLIGQNYRPMPWCIRCGTSLSEHEMTDADAYKDVTHLAVFFKLPIKEINAKMLVWTTTPWTLSSNVAIAVNPELEYSICKVKSDEVPLVVCSSALKVLKDDLVEIEKTVLGKDLVGYTYETCFKELKQQNFDHKIVAWEDVGATEGSGAVHIAPGCGAEDFDLGQKIGLPNVLPIDEAGVFYEDFGFLAGLNAQADETRDLIFDRLKQENKLYYFHKYNHRYPHCWRCKNPLMFRLIKEWVIKVDDIRPKLIEEAAKVEWHPDFLGKRMKDWLENMGDWSISRPRFYGLPLPFYPCKECGHVTVVGSKEELKELAIDNALDSVPHLHRPYIDKVKIKCPHCGKAVERILEVGDCWLDAGIAPFSTKKYFEDKEFWEKNFPADTVIEGKEQVRLWFYSMLVMSVVITGKTPFSKAMGTPMLLAQDGKKLSKSSPNNIPLDTVYKEIGADLVRYNFVNTPLLNDVKFGYETVDEVRRKLLNLWNTYVFFETYAGIDNPDITGYTPDVKTMDISDKWLVERTNAFVNKSTTAYDNIDFGTVTKEFETFIDEVSNWYIRINRRRFWKGENGTDKMNAYYCLAYAIKNVCIVLAPITPFFSEYLWQNLVREVDKNAAESVMLSEYKVADFEVNSYDLVEKTNVVRDIITLASRIRNENQLPVKQPLKTMYVCAENEVKDAIALFEDIIKDELNIKEIVIEHDETRFNDEYLVVNFKTAGAVLKGDVQKVKVALENLAEDEIKAVVKGYNEGKVTIGDYKDLDSSLFIKNSKPKTEFVLAKEGSITVVIDTTLTEELKNEGILREIIRNAQVLRKEADFKIDARVLLNITSSDDNITKILKDSSDKIATEVLAKAYNTDTFTPDIEREVEVGDGKKVTISLKTL